MKETKSKKIIIILAVLMVCMLGIGAVAFSNSSLLGVKEADKNQNNEYRDFVEPTKEQLDNGNLNICLITKSYGNGYWDTLIQGAVDAANDIGVNLYVAGVAKENNTTGLVMLMEKALSMKPDAIVVSPADTKDINEIVDKINEENIPLIFVDTILNGQQFDACYMTDNMQAGRMVAWDMLTKLKSKGHKEDESLSIGIDIGSRQSQTIIERLAGFNEYWSDNAPEEWKVIDKIKCNDGDANVAYNQCLEFFEENQNLAGLIGLNNGSTVGLSRGVSEMNRKDLVLVGFDYSDEIAALIQDGEFTVSTMVQRQYDMGYGSIESAVDICKGNKQNYKYYNTGVSRVDNGNYNNPYIRAKVLRE